MRQRQNLWLPFLQAGKSAKYVLFFLIVVI